MLRVICLSGCDCPGGPDRSAGASLPSRASTSREDGQVPRLEGAGRGFAVVGAGPGASVPGVDPVVSKAIR